MYICWSLVGLISAGFGDTSTCVIIFWSIQKYSQIWVPWEKAEKNTILCSKKKYLIAIIRLCIHCPGLHEEETQTSGNADLSVKTLLACQIWECSIRRSWEAFHIRHRASSLPLRVCISKPLTLQMSALHHCENWCFWAVQSGVEHIRVQDIWAHQSTERQAHPPLEGSNLYHLTLKDLWV